MAQITTGLRSILSHPRVYDFLQSSLGSSNARREFVDRYVQFESQPQRLLDIGCGTAEILPFLPEHIAYYGFDASEAYIDAARERYGDRGEFVAKIVTDAVVDEYEAFDRVIATGLLHHLDDDEVSHLFQVAKQALGSQGKFVSIDPCFVQGQSFFSEYLVRRDRGQNVRVSEDYAKLARQVFDTVELHHRNDLLRIPYDHTILVCGA